MYRRILTRGADDAMITDSHVPLDIRKGSTHYVTSDLRPRDDDGCRVNHFHCIRILGALRHPPRASPTRGSGKVYESGLAQADKTSSFTCAGLPQDHVIEHLDIHDAAGVNDLLRDADILC